MNDYDRPVKIGNLRPASSDEPNSSNQNPIHNDSIWESQVIKVQFYSEFKDSSNLHYLEDLKYLGPAKTKELECDTYYSKDMHSAKCCILRARLPIELYSRMRTSRGRGFDGISRQPSEMGFTFFGMNAFGLDNKVWEQEFYFDVKQMYEFLDVKDLITTYIKSSNSFTQVLSIFCYCQFLEISIDGYAST